MSLDLPGLVFAFTAGIFAIFSPCGYALIPGYISYYLGRDFSVTRAIIGGFTCMLGLITVFTIIGFMASMIGEVLMRNIPLLDLIAGIALVVMGFMTLTHRELPYFRFSAKPSQRKDLAGLYVFGVIYGLAGVGCSAPIFLSVIFYALTRDLTNGVVSLLLYAFGMGFPLMITSLLLSKAKDYMIGRIFMETRRIQKISGIMLIIVGVYLLYYHYIT